MKIRFLKNKYCWNTLLCFLFSGFLILSFGVDSASAEAVMSIRRVGACGKAWQKVSRTRYRQTRNIADGALCRVRVYLHDRATKRPLASQQVQVFTNLGSRTQTENSCYDPASLVFVTDRFGRANVSFPWDASACSVAFQPVTSSTGASAVRLDLTRFVNSSHRHSCELGSSSNTPSRRCQAMSVEGSYEVKDAVLEVGQCDGFTFRPLDNFHITISKDAAGYDVLMNADGRWGIGGSVDIVTNDTVQVTDRYNGRFGSYTRTLTISQLSSASPQVLFSHYSVSSGLTDASTVTPSETCSYTYRGVATRQ